MIKVKKIKYMVMDSELAGLGSTYPNGTTFVIDDVRGNDSIGWKGFKNDVFLVDSRDLQSGYTIEAPESEVMKSLSLKFTSGNSCPVTQAIITREEFEAIKELLNED